MASASDESEQKKLSSEKIQEWDVVRRTLEHFDNKLTNLHTIGLTVTFILYGLYFQTKSYYIGMFIAFFNGVLILEERFTRDYLHIASEIARNIEQKYAFAHPALTEALHKQSREAGFVSRNAFFILYISFVVIGLGIVISGIGLLTYILGIL